MRQSNRYIDDLLDLDAPEARADVLWRAGKVVGVECGDDADGAVAWLRVPFFATAQGGYPALADAAPRECRVAVRLYGGEVARLSVIFSPGAPPEVPDAAARAVGAMISLDASLSREALCVREVDGGWEIIDADGRARVRVDNRPPPGVPAGRDRVAPFDDFRCTVYPDGRTPVDFSAHDTFLPTHIESLGLAFIERGCLPHRAAWSFAASAAEKFAGTGERFRGMNLAGQTLDVSNVDARGTNTRRAYKNVPFYLSSRPYGLFAHTAADVRLSLADLSTRAASGVVADAALDLFLVGGGTPERILHNYRRLTGFPPPVPLWSYGVWMSRMTYHDAEETFEVARRLREGGFPADVIHLDTGYFETDWKCDWALSRERFGEPAEYFARMRRMGFRVSLWQRPELAKDTSHYRTAVRRGFTPPERTLDKRGSDFGGIEYGGSVDFSNPDAVVWYKGLLGALLQQGASAIKADFGEEIDMEVAYACHPRILHNLYALLYQRAAFEAVREATGEGVIWARSGWAGAQRYPVHWCGDPSATWEGMAGAFRGGLHLGASGFAFWSSDVPGFYGLPGFRSSDFSDELYIRWTQAATLTSHIRFHGTSPREPYNRPAASDVVRKWLRLRYALLPYLAREGARCAAGGLPLMRALLFAHPDDPFAWYIDDQWYCGERLLAAPVMNPGGRRDVYLPDGRWVDFWTGELIDGPRLLKSVFSPLDRMPLYAVAGARIPVYPERVDSTNDMEMGRAVELPFDATYLGAARSILGDVCEF